MSSLSKSDALSTEQLGSLLSKHDINPTPQRMHIAALMLQRKQHISAEEVLAGVNHATPLVSKATVYNTLNLFVKKGLIREVLIDPSRIFYDSNTSKHHHIYNVDTGELTDLSLADIQISNIPKLPDGQVLEGVDLIIRIKNG